MKASSIVLASLFTVQTPTAKRVKTLSSFFEPKPKSMIKIDSYQNKGAEDHFLDAYLHVTVKPPKNQCFILSHQNGYDIKDKYICDRQTIFFRLKEIDQAGRIHLNVITGEKDAVQIYIGKPLTELLVQL